MTNETRKPDYWLDPDDCIALSVEDVGPDTSGLIPLYASPPDAGVGTRSPDECPHCGLAWKEHRPGYGASRCKTRIRSALGDEDPREKASQREALRRRETLRFIAGLLTTEETEQVPEAAETARVLDLVINRARDTLKGAH